MSRHIHSTLLIATLSSAALIASCGGTSMSPEADMLSSTSQNAQMVGGSSSHPGIIAQEPFLLAEGKGASDVFDFPDFDLPPDVFDPGFDIDLWWESLHNAVSEGDNAISLENWLAKSASASEQLVITGSHEIFPGFEVPDFGMGIGLVSAAGEMSYVSYGLKDIPAGKSVQSIHIKGGGTEGSGDQHGLYLGVGNYSDGSYRWYGPYDLADGEYTQDIYLMDSVNDTGHAYVVLAVYGGDEFVLTNLDVAIGDPLPVFELPELPEIPEFGF